jgi:hypothetical protein
MKWAMTIPLCVLAAALAAAQNPSVIQNTRATMNGARDTSTAASNFALAAQPKPASNPASASAKSHATAHPPEHAHRVHPRKMIQPAVLEKASAPKAESAPPKKIGEIVGTPAPAAEDGTGSEEDAASAQTYSANGRRDPFVSPVVSQRAGGSGCMTGKKCLEIGAINLRGVVHSENGFIAVVSNSLNKAYFLHENDPVFNGYVVKITGDSIVFQETLQDRLGKTFTREVVKKITVPAV